MSYEKTHYSYDPVMVCPKRITFDIEDNIITNIRFVGGCPGNTLALSKLLEGKTVEYIEDMLSGNRCGMKPTSCADQLAKAVRRAYNEIHE